MTMEKFNLKDWTQHIIAVGLAGGFVYGFIEGTITVEAYNSVALMTIGWFFREVMGTGSK